MNAPAVCSVAEIFAANRARGRVELSVAAADGMTRVSRLREEGSLRLRFPHTPRGAAQAVLLNKGGGMAGGDRFRIDLHVGAGASLTLTTAAAEKTYRALGPAAAIDVHLQVETDATLAWLPQETILFDGARLARTITVELAANSSLMLAEAIVFGRTAMGETIGAGSFTDRWRIRRGGRLIYAEGVRLENAIDTALRRAACGAAATALATVLSIPGDNAMVARVRALEQEFRGEVAASAWNGLAAVRLMAREGASLRHDLALVVQAAGSPLPRIWQN